jgi:hypothetical protein
MEPIDRHHTFDGLILDNAVLSVGDLGGKDNRADVEQRKPKKDMSGFIETCYTPQSKVAGRVRMLTSGVMIRVRTGRTGRLYEMAHELLSVLLDLGLFNALFRRRSWKCSNLMRDIVE